MKKRSSYILLSYLSFLLIFIQCKKGSADNDVPETKLSFQMNGKTTNDLSDGGPILDNDYRMRGILFRNLTSAFPGDVIFFYSSPPGCAFTSSAAPYFRSSDCKLEFFEPVDSSIMYSYRSGSLNYSYSACKRKKAYDPIAGLRFEYDECAVTGTFSLTLANYLNETIVITNGSFTFYPVRK